MASSDEINRINRTSDINRWKSMDFVVGYEIKRSNNPDAKCDICDKLAGIYPKSFLWSGWHDECKCYAVPVMVSKEEFNTDELNELKAAIMGEEYKPKKPNGFIDLLPKNFFVWYANNVEQMLNTNNFPSFILDNIDLIKVSYEKYSKNNHGNHNR